jgi:hypothetical protein
MPDWPTVAIAVATPLLAFAGAFGGQVLARKGAKELDTWRRREETMRMLRWGAERAVDRNPRLGEVGFAALRALSGSELLQPEDERFIDLVVDAAIADPLAALSPAGQTEVVEE